MGTFAIDKPVKAIMSSLVFRDFHELLSNVSFNSLPQRTSELQSRLQAKITRYKFMNKFGL